MMRTGRVLMAVLGTGVIGYGLYGLLTDPHIDDPLGILVWAAGAVALHDGLWLPVVCLIGALAARDVVLRSGLIVAASLTIVALPAVLRENSAQDNPTLLPLPYQRNLLLLLGGCAVITMTIWAIRRTRSRRARQP